MKTRRPPLDFINLPVRWAPDAGVAAVLNAGGALAPAVEPYLNRVMGEAARKLGPQHAALKADIATLIRQETEHFKLHEAFNQALYAQGYVEIAPIVEALKRDLAGQFKGRSLAFNLAWCAGFETFTLYLGQYIFGPGAHWLEGADPRAIDLWRWHLAEEYEHRSVCHDAFAALIDDWPLRAWAIGHVHGHIGRYRRRVEAVLGDPGDGAFARDMAADLAPRVLPAMLPFYHPSKAAPPPGLEAELARHPEAA